MKYSTEGEQEMNNGINLHGEFDAMIWANAFEQVLQENPNIVSKDTMLGWFANAIMAGYDTAQRIDQTEINRLLSIIEDYREGIAKTLEDKCPSDERHCGCVPILREELTRLGNENTTLKQKINRQDRFAGEARDELANRDKTIKEQQGFMDEYMRGWKSISRIQQLEEKLASRDALIKKLTKHFVVYVEDDEGDDYSYCIHCRNDNWKSDIEIVHAPDCPIVQVMKELEK